MADHNELGKEGEERAAVYFASEGYKILERNWRYHPKEIDLIAQKDDLLIIAEIKTRSTEDWEHPQESITNSKIRFLVDATEAYIMENDIDLEVRFDVVSVIPDGTTWKIDHIKEAFYPPTN
ncbi:YraN family protein [Labilibacter marinus]|uniref:YraN family protein n=1 Tax=Labilibacter marinus TaxID=1477105 RepID=UPI00094F6294|nr:YraN family protein [Labilibacter marinus]